MPVEAIKPEGVSYKWTSAVEDAAFRAIFMQRVWDAVRDVDTLRRTAISMGFVWDSKPAKDALYSLQDRLMKEFKPTQE